MSKKSKPTYTDKQLRALSRDEIRALGRRLTRYAGGKEVKTATSIRLSEDNSYFIIKSKRTYHIVDAKTGKIVEGSDTYIPTPSIKVKVKGGLPR